MLPLSEKLRPHTNPALILNLGLSKTLAPFLSGTYISSLIFWGPPGCGKTTAARLIGNAFKLQYKFQELSAVASGVKDIKELADSATEKPVILFLDEIHRFNKSQQDSLLPHVESGRIILIGATTENPSFYVIAPLLSRSRVVVFSPLSEDALKTILENAEKEISISIEDNLKEKLITASQGDARRLITILEHLTKSNSLNHEGLKQYFLDTIPYDKSGDQHYNFASAFIKSIRGSDPDAALFYAFKMIEAGEDPRFIFRRLILSASEDIGNADPNALKLAVAGAEAFDRIGMPEGRIPLAQVITYLAVSPKSNRSYLAMHKAIEAVEKYPDAVPPVHLRNAPTGLMKGLGIGEGYQYVHDAEGAFIPGIKYLPEVVKDGYFYEPGGNGTEAKIRERLMMLRQSSKKKLD